MPETILNENKLKLLDSLTAIFKESPERKALWMHKLKNDSSHAIDSVPESDAYSIPDFDGSFLQPETKDEQLSIFGGDQPVSDVDTGESTSQETAGESNERSAWISSGQPPSLYVSLEDESNVVDVGTRSGEALEIIDFADICPPAPPTTYTSCSGCEITLDAIRYVCASCGEKKPSNHLGSDTSTTPGERKDTARKLMVFNPDLEAEMTVKNFGDSVSSSTPRLRADELLSPQPRSFTGTSESPLTLQQFITRTSARAGSPSPMSLPGVGYELCVSCIEQIGVVHGAAHASRFAGSELSNRDSLSSDELSEWMRSAPEEKGHLRHAFIEMIWGLDGWTDVGTSSYKFLMFV